MTARKETTSKAPRKIVSIIRVSSDQQAQDEKTGLRRQEEDIEIHCKTMNLEVVKKFDLPGIGGSNVQNTKAYREMLETLNQPDVVGICFSELSRFFRPENITTLSDVFKPLPKDTLLFCDLGEISLTDPNDMIKLALWGSMAGHEKARIKNRMQRGKAILRAMPDAKIDPLPRGVEFTRTSDRANTGTFRYTDYARTTVREAFLRVSGGQKLKRVAQDLGFGNQVSLRACLKSGWWVGEKRMTKKRINRTWNTEKDKLTTGQRVAHPEPIVVKTNLAEDPLISQDLFDTVQDLLAGNHKTWTQNKTLVNEFLGAGLLYCSCGCRMYHKVTNHDGKQWAYYICSGRYTKKTDCKQPILAARGEYSADQLISWELETKFAEKGFVQARIEEALAARDTDETQRTLTATKAAVKELEEQQENFAVAIASTKNQTVIKSLVRKMEALDTETSLARTKARQAAKEATSAIDPVAAAVQVQKDFAGFVGFSVTKQKELLNEYVSRIDFVPPSCAGDISGMFNVTMKISSLGVSKLETPF
jgi:DNA invertase Pin-like site-specific DNA recombinase